MWNEKKRKISVKRKRDRSIRKTNRIRSFNLANRRIEQLYTLAEVSMIENPLFAIKCVKLAHKIASRSRVRISQSFRRKTCQKCFNFLRPSVNCQIRTRSSSQPHLVLHCYNCGKITRFPYKKVQ